MDLYERGITVVAKATLPMARERGGGGGSDDYTSIYPFTQLCPRDGHRLWPGLAGKNAEEGTRIVESGITIYTGN
jgi:hypothetical protein